MTSDNYLRAIEEICEAHREHVHEIHRMYQRKLTLISGLALATVALATIAVLLILGIRGA